MPENFELRAKYKTRRQWPNASPQLPICRFREYSGVCPLFFLVIEEKTGNANRESHRTPWFQSKYGYSFTAGEMIDHVNTATHAFLAVRFLKKIKCGSYIFKPNTTKKLLAEYWRRQIYNLNNPDGVQIQHDALEYRLPKGYIRDRFFLYRENSIGRIFLSVATSSDFSGLQKEIYSIETKVSDLKAKLLLKQQQQMNGL